MITSTGMEAMLEELAKLAAIDAAAAHPGASYAVYKLANDFIVRDATTEKPEGAELLCIAQIWDNTAIQLRYAGGHSEWRTRGSNVAIDCVEGWQSIQIGEDKRDA